MRSWVELLGILETLGKVTFRELRLVSYLILPTTRLDKSNQQATLLRKVTAVKPSITLGD